MPARFVSFPRLSSFRPASKETRVQARSIRGDASYAIGHDWPCANPARACITHALSALLSPLVQLEAEERIRGEIHEIRIKRSAADGGEEWRDEEDEQGRRRERVGKRACAHARTHAHARVTRTGFAVVCVTHERELPRSVFVCVCMLVTRGDTSRWSSHRLPIHGF